MIRHFFLDKTNTIIENSYQNLGLNPILGVGYGQFLMRGLLHFDMSQIKELVDDKTFADTSKLKFTLKMTNCFSVDSVPYKNKMHISPDFKFERATSFDLMLFKLDVDFDMGRGFDYKDDLYVQNRYAYNEDGSNWYFAKKCIPWRYEMSKFDLNAQSLNGRYYDRRRADNISGEVIDIAERFNDGDIGFDRVKEKLEVLAKSRSLNSYSLKGGKHQTKEVVLLPYKNGYLVDTPGFYSLQLNLKKDELAKFYPGMYIRNQDCYYSNCLHLNEKQCAIKQDLENGKLHQVVYDNYLNQLKEIEEEKR